MIRRGPAVWVGVLALSCGALPAAAGTHDTVVALRTAAGLTISDPASVTLGSATAGSTVSGQLGTVTVTDGRGGLNLLGWTATVSTTTFTTGGGTAPETIGKAAVKYASGPATAADGVGTALAGQATTLLAASLGSPVTAFSLTGGLGSNTVSWNPTVSVAIPAGAVVGTYTGTITHSVA